MVQAKVWQLTRLKDLHQATKICIIPVLVVDLSVLVISEIIEKTICPYFYHWRCNHQCGFCWKTFVCLRSAVMSS